MYRLFHKETQQYMVHINTGIQFIWTTNIDKATSFPTKAEAIQFFTFEFCSYFRSKLGGTLSHVIKDVDIVFDEINIPDPIKSYDRAMRGI